MNESFRIFSNQHTLSDVNTVLVWACSLYFTIALHVFQQLRYKNVSVAGENHCMNNNQ